MFNSITFLVPETARGKHRPVVTKGGRHVYTPDVAGWGEAIGWYATQATGRPMWEGPISIHFYVTRQMPKSWSNKMKAKMDGQWCLTRPDVVNIGALICDALEGILYHEDKTVVSITGTKRWGYHAITEIGVEQLESCDSSY